VTVRELYDFLAENPQVKDWPVLVRYTVTMRWHAALPADRPDHSHPVITVSDSYVC
jgi:hypothetical protein